MFFLPPSAQDAARRAAGVAAAAAALWLGVAGCGQVPAVGDGSRSAPLSQPAVMAGVGPHHTGSATSTTGTAVLRPLGSANPSPKTQRPSEPAQLAVAGVRVGNHEGFDRVVVDLAGDGDPGWFVDYTPTPLQATIGRPLPVSGTAFLSINVDGTVYPGELGLDETGVERLSPTSNIVDVASGGTYAGRSQIVVGLRAEAPYSVQVLEDPKRLVIDIVQG
ncbi:hypothetical protein V6D40_02610 [Corynebacterium sp. Q4381]|uniref:AMIN-like domain-containing (lipo)protein n=1 Tax=Corynebacterium sp. Marseille-Q4381 TaxID=3121597 RepID=UPI002FE60963